MNLINDNSATGDRDRLHQVLIDWMDEHVDPQRGMPWQNRSWRNAHRNDWQFTSPMRPFRDDGIMPPILDYDSGRGTRGTAVQFSDEEG